MNHIDEDRILKYVLEILTKEEIKVVNNHISECELCNSQLISLQKEMDLIGSFDPKVENEFILRLENNSFNTTWLKRAAILILGFSLGYFTSEILKPEQIIIVEQNLVSQSDSIKYSSFIDCPSIDIYQVNSL